MNIKTKSSVNVELTEKFPCKLCISKCEVPYKHTLVEITYVLLIYSIQHDTMYTTILYYKRISVILTRDIFKLKMLSNNAS
jgi:hypothetical protein